jgi:hypothetical protein
MKGLLLALLISSAAASAADDPALAAVEACRARLQPARDVGLDAIEKRCPNLLSAIDKAPWRNLMPQDLRSRRDELSAEGLRELAVLVRRSQAEAPDREPPQVERLAPVLAELGDQAQAGATRWERFKRWLKEKLQRREGEENADSWRDRLRRKFSTSEGVAQAITYAGYVLMGLLVAFVVVSELRAAGLLGGRRREQAQAGTRAAWRRRLELADVAAAPLADRPGLLLRLLGETLARLHRLPAADGLTATAIVRRARLDDEKDRADLQRIAVAADAVRYGARPPSPPELEATTESATSLLGRVSRLPKEGR